MSFSYYKWLSEILIQEFEPPILLKKSERGSVSLIRHHACKEKFILRRFTGNAEVYQTLLNYTYTGLPHIYDLASDRNRHLVLEQYIQGDNMGTMLKETLFTSSETRHIVRQLCRALWLLHSMGAVHRDVKPENIILRGTDAVLIDFDAARIYKDSSTNDTQILGTTGFAAPEQYGLSQTNPCSDIYAVGVLINVMLTGRHPTDRLAEGRWGHIVTRCTQIHPAKRYKNILCLLDRL